MSGCINSPASASARGGASDTHDSFARDSVRDSMSRMPGTFVSTPGSSFYEWPSNRLTHPGASAASFAHPDSSPPGLFVPGATPAEGKSGQQPRGAGQGCDTDDEWPENPYQFEVADHNNTPSESSWDHRTSKFCRPRLSAKQRAAEQHGNDNDAGAAKGTEPEPTEERTTASYIARSMRMASAQHTTGKGGRANPPGCARMAGNSLSTEPVRAPFAQPPLRFSVKHDDDLHADPLEDQHADPRDAGVAEPAPRIVSLERMMASSTPWPLRSGLHPHGELHGHNRDVDPASDLGDLRLSDRLAPTAPGPWQIRLDSHLDSDLHGYNRDAAATSSFGKGYPPTWASASSAACRQPHSLDFQTVFSSERTTGSGSGSSNPWPTRTSGPPTSAQQGPLHTSSQNFSEQAESSFPGSLHNPPPVLLGSANLVPSKFRVRRLKLEDALGQTDAAGAATSGAALSEEFGQGPAYCQPNASHDFTPMPRAQQDKQPPFGSQSFIGDETRNQRRGSKQTGNAGPSTGRSSGPASGSQPGSRCPSKQTAEAAGVSVDAGPHMGNQPGGATRNKRSASKQETDAGMPSEPSIGTQQDDVTRNRQGSQGQAGEAGAQTTSKKAPSMHAVLRRLFADDYAAVTVMLTTAGRVSRFFVKSLIHECLKASRAKAAMWCVSEMSKWGVDPDITSFNVVLNGCVKSKNYGLCLQWWAQLAALRLAPNNVTYNTMINACAQARRPTEAEAMLEEMLQVGVAPCKISFTAVVGAFATLGDAARAEKWLVRMRDMGVQGDEVIYNAFLNACAKAGDLQTAQRWAAQMVKDGINPGIRTYNALIHACAKLGSNRVAASLYTEMIAAGLEPDLVTFGSLIDANAQVGGAVEAEHWMNKICAAGLTPNLVCFNSMLNACALAGDYPRAQAWFAKMIPSGCAPCSITFNCMISVCTYSGDQPGLVAMVEDMISQNIHPNMVTVRTVRQALRPMESHKKTAHLVHFYCTVIRKYMRLGNSRLAVQWLWEMSKSCSKPSPDFLSEVVETLHATRRLEDAKLAHDIQTMLL